MGSIAFLTYPKSQIFPVMLFLRKKANRENQENEATEKDDLPFNFAIWNKALKLYLIGQSVLFCQ